MEEDRLRICEKDKEIAEMIEKEIERNKVEKRLVDELRDVKRSKE